MQDKLSPVLLTSSQAAHARGAPAAAGRPRYRSDIDGLRAVAVLPVLAFHVGIHIARGGFVGVDVFFVISGFLITQLLVADILADRFSLASFYERRIRRILPALVPVLLVTYVLGVVYCLPDEMVALSKSLVAASLSASNFYFWQTAGYFDGPALSKPLLHTWSLAVEEQFYFFWPLYLFVGHRYFRRHLLLITSVIATVSLSTSIVGAFNSPNATFYLPFTRLWELATGGLLALGAVPVALGRPTRNTLAAVGLALISTSVFAIDSDMPFPGLLAVPPCLGAALIILGGRDGESYVGEVLSLKPIVFIGLISYSLYLWHWPITVFQENYSAIFSGTSERTTKMVLVGTSVVAAALSWKFIEQPFRISPRRPSNRLLVAMAATGTLVLVALGGIAWASRGFPGRYSSRELKIASYLSYNALPEERVGSCFLTGKTAAKQFAPECLALSTSKKNYLLLGDSHAAELWGGLSATFKEVNFLQATSADCFPTIRHSISESSRCTTLLDDVITRFLTTRHVDNVLLVARWKPALLDKVATTIDWMKERSIPVTLVGPTAFFDVPVPRLLVSALRESDPALPERHLEPSLRALDAEMRELARSHGVAYVSMLSLLCAPGACVTKDAEGLPLIFDREHYTAEGSLFAAQSLSKLRDVW
jgi:peptidoglycan/LPS O-acetylase OafA/YrhL